MGGSSAAARDGVVDLSQLLRGIAGAIPPMWQRRSCTLTIANC